MTTNVELEEMGKDLPNFKVRMIYNLPPTIKENESGIINMDNDPQGQGTHWVCFHARKNEKYTVYVDSFGVHPDERIVKMLKSLGKPLLSSTKQLQNITSQNCGAWCIRVLRELNSGKKLTTILSEFDGEDQVENEQKLKRNN